RRAEPSRPWPWVDFNADLESVDPDETADERWKGYPQSFFPNWTLEQIERSNILSGFKDTEDCWTYRVDVFNNGSFEDRPLPLGKHKKETTWKLIQEKRPKDICVRVLFVNNLPRPIMQMLGTHYDIDPFFFSTSVNWIPSHYQEDLQPRGDHITITLPFIRPIRNVPISATKPLQPIASRQPLPNKPINTQASLSLFSTDHVLLTDLIAIHMVRTASPSSSTILSYHPAVCVHRTSAKLLHSLILQVGRNLYWSEILHASTDPTFILVAILWYALYSWEEAFEKINEHSNWLEARVINTNETYLTRDLHILQAHLLHYTSLLDEFRRSVDFVMNTPNPAMESCQEKERLHSQRLMKKECENLKSEIDRLEAQRKMQSSRLKNAMDLAFANVAIRDSNAMKQISYLSIIFLPGSFAAALFGMNVKEIQPGSLETLANFVAVTIGLTILTICLVLVGRARNPVHEHGESDGLFAKCLWWPVSKTLKVLRMGKGKEVPHDEEEAVAGATGATTET
ncbi:hypothetical protein BV22DRAFT_1003390, partial [Leucogyrophana mollusca]